MDKEIIAEKELDELGKNLRTEIKKLKIAMSQLETDVAILQTGDAKGAYWSGPNAYHYTKNCLAHLDHDYNLLKNLNKCSLYIDSLIK